MGKEAHLDTHLVVWLYSGNLELINQKIRDIIETHEVFFSPIVKLEIQYLKEINKIKETSEKVIEALKNEIGLKESKADFSKVVDASIKLSWTRDPFDRLIVSNALITNSVLLTKDDNILRNYKKAVWY
jgi:PIN domain nuclease of toxin-antitoxin system